MILEVTRPVQGGLRQEKKLEAVSNHLANADTPGFKRDVVSFDREFRAQMNTDLSQANIRKTGNVLDLALADEGFFKVDTAAGIRYTRNGNFNLDSSGALVTNNGDPVLGQGGPVMIDGSKIQIDRQGRIFVDDALAGTLDIVTFGDLTRLVKEGGDNYEYRGDTRDEQAPLNIAVEQKALEDANVKVVEEMVRMIDYHRMYETFTKSISTFDEIDGQAINNVGKLT